MAIRVKYLFISSRQRWGERDRQVREVKVESVPCLGRIKASEGPIWEWFGSVWVLA